MSRIPAFIAGAALAAAALVGANGIAYAATGHNLIIGQANKSKTLTTLSRTGAGPALKLKTRKTQPPLSVNSRKVVANLNASLVGGLSASALQTRDVKYTVPNSKKPAGDATFALPGLPAGDYVASIDIIAQMSNAGDNINCSIDPTGKEDSYVMGYGSVYNQYSTISATGVLRVPSGGTLELYCFADGSNTFSIIGPPASVDFVKIDGITARAARLTTAN